MGNTFYFNWEVSLIEHIQNILNEFGIKLMSLISSLGEEMVMVLILAIFYLCIDKQFGKRLGFVITMGTVFNPLIKNLFFRNRPYVDHSSIKCLKVVDSEGDIYDLSIQGYSFPSGHSTNSAICYGYLSTYFKKTWVKLLLLLIPLLVGISRFSLGVHYPTDVIFGWLLGILLILLFNIIDRKFGFTKATILFLILGLVGFFYCKSTDYFTGYGLMLGAALGFILEERKVNFKMPKNLIFGVVRVIIAIGIFYGLNILLKLPFNKEFLDSGIILAYIVRTIRYAIITFVITGVYPHIFTLEEKIGLKK